MKHHFEPFNSKYMAGCQQPFWSKMASDNWLSAAILGPKRLVTTGCQQPSPLVLCCRYQTLNLYAFDINRMR